MDADRLFLVRCGQIIGLLESNDEVDLLDLSGLLRQMLVDQHALINSVNPRTDKVLVEFHVGTFTSKPDQFTTLLSLEDGIDPQTRRPGAPSVTLSLPKFLKHVVMHASGDNFTIQNVILHAAESAGGVHLNPKSKRHKALAHLSQQASVGGLPLGIRMLKAIGRVTIRAINPLIERVEKRSSS